MLKLLILTFGALSIEAKKGACAICTCYWRNSHKYVDCSYMKLTAIPEGISTKTSRLFLNGNNITDIGITSTFGSNLLPKLRVLQLNNNPIQYIADDAFQMMQEFVTHINNGGATVSPEEQAFNIE